MPDSTELYQRGSLMDQVDTSGRLSISDKPFDRLTHYLFRFPAKFHPPVVKFLLERYTNVGDWVLDPFCGSGSMMVEAAILGRHAVGSDVDPVATYISQVKTHRYNVERLRNSSAMISDLLTSFRRTDDEYIVRQFQDISSSEFMEFARNNCSWIPDIPNILHWFRKYVVVDLVQIKRVISSAPIPETHRQFFLLCFASIIRASSNADPVPVSGLEVTSYMKLRDRRGRVVDSFRLFDRAVSRALSGVSQFREKMDASFRVSTVRRDARALPSRFGTRFDAIITSPPYHNAVDYYRRHKLEMFWLDLTESQAERLELMREYVGRGQVAQKDAFPGEDQELDELASNWESRIRAENPARATAFRHYVLSMRLAFQEFHRVLKPGKPVVLVVGNSKWNGDNIPTADLFIEFSRGRFRVAEQFWYPIKNRYMSYKRRNGANINKEHVLVMYRDAE